MADFHRQPFDGACDHGERGEIHRVAIARDHLRADGFRDQSQLVRHVGFYIWRDIGEGAHRAADRAGRDFGARIPQPRAAAVEFGIGLRQFEPEGDGFGVDAVAAPDGGGQFVFFRPALQRSEQLVHVRQQDVGRADQLDGERRVEHVRAGHALVHEARFLAHMLGHPGQEGDHVVLGHRLDRVDRVDVDFRVGFPPVPQGLGRAFGHNAQLGELLRRVRLDLEPDAIFRLRLPQGGHFGAGVAGDHCGAPGAVKGCKRRG